MAGEQRRGAHLYEPEDVTRLRDRLATLLREGDEVKEDARIEGVAMADLTAEAARILDHPHPELLSASEHVTWAEIRRAA